MFNPTQKSTINNFMFSHERTQMHIINLKHIANSLNMRPKCTKGKVATALYCSFYVDG